MKLKDANPYIRAAMIQPAVLEGDGARIAYDCRLFYVLEGEGFFVTDGGDLPIAPDTLIFFYPGFGYHFRGKMRVIVLNFDMTRVAADKINAVCPPPAAEFDANLIFDSSTASELPSPIVRPNSRHLRDELLTIVHFFDQADPIADAVTSARLKGFLAELVRGERRDEDASGALVEEVKRYIRIRAPEIADNREIGQHFGYHPVYIATLFRERTGESLHRAILSERVRLAKEWLVRTALSIEEIAENVGFSSRSHFCTTFKEFVGVSPLKYRTSER